MSEASVSVRLNPFKGLSGPEGAPVPWNRYGRILDARPVFTLDPLFHAGCYYVQDSSAMFVGHLFRKYAGKGPLKVLDLCAAPGGKTTDLAASLREMCGDDFLLVSNEVMKDRARILSDNVALWGDPAVMVTSADPAAFASFEGMFDVIVCDAPCSGEGMFRKDERARREWSPAVVDLCCARQKRILADVWPALADDGLMIYSTCTYEKSENDDNLRWAAGELSGEILPPEDEFGSYGVELTECGSLLRDGVVPGEGQWAGALRKTGGRRMRGSVVAAAQIIRDRLHPLRYGVNRGVGKAGKLIPDPDFALSLQYDNSYPAIDVDLHTALAYLHHDALRFPDAPRGFNLITYLGHPLGFVNNLGTRCNTLHPLSRRILMDI
ncbi:MAG: rRNA cytosine-C5-methyltransferase [Bacteroidales bacterium]|nr:rRNA cytosine-C5-methyltransferase [Bacteroidales bacterium]